MPIEFQIDHARRTVWVKCVSPVAVTDFFAYQRDVWSRPDVAGYDEFVDAVGVADITLPSSVGTDFRDLVQLSAQTDSRATTAKLAIVAPDDLSFGLARMYETYRELNPRSTKLVAVFRSRDEALKWIAAKDDSPPA